MAPRHAPGAVALLVVTLLGHGVDAGRFSMLAQGRASMSAHRNMEKNRVSMSAHNEAVAFLAQGQSQLMNQEQAEAAAKGLADVIELLSSMLKAFDEQAVEDRELWESYSEWSDNAETEKNELIQEQEALVMSTEATMASNKQMVAKLTAELKQLAEDIKENEASLKELIEMREEEHAQYEASLAEVTKTIRAVSKATEILAGHYSASGAALVEIRKRVQVALTMYGLHMESATPENMAGLASFLQGGSDAKGPDFLNADGSKYENYEKQGGAKGVLGMLEDLHSQLTSQKQELITTENNNRLAFESNKAEKEAELKQEYKVQAEKTEKKAQCEATIEECIVTIKEAKQEIADAQSYLTTLLADRKKFQGEFNKRTTKRTQERAATQAALDALQSVSAGAQETVEGGFLQISSSSTTSTRLQRIQHVIAVLTQAGKQPGATALLQLAATLRQDYMGEDQQSFFKASKFDPVLNLLKDLITRLEEEQNAETSQHEWCENEKTQSVNTQKERDTLIHELKGTIESKTTTVEQLKSDILFLESEIRRVEKETKEAIKVRNEQNKLFLAAKADHEEVIGAIKQALSALGGQYGFLQISSHSAGKQAQAPGQENVFNEYSSGGEGAASAMQMLSDLLEKYTSALQQLTEQEAAQKKAHEELLAKNKKFIQDTQADVNGKLEQRRGLLGELTSEKADLKTNMIELHEVSKYLMDLRPSCDDIRSTYEERKKRREAEISALKEALEVISDPTMQGF